MHGDVNPNTIIEMLESKLGYNFTVRELPPSLRAKLRSLEQELTELRGKRSKYECEITSIGRQEKAEEENIANKYNAELSKLESQKSELIKWKGVDTLFQIVGVLMAFFLIIIAFLPVAWAYMLGFPYAITLVIGLILGVLFLSGIFWIPVVIRQAMQHRKERRAEGKLQSKRNGIENQRNHDLKVLRAKYEESRKQHPAILEAKQKEITFFEKKFDTDFNQTASEIDSALNAIFQAKMDFGFLRTIIRNRGVVIEEISCPYCGGKMELPETGHVTKCKYCDRDVYAVDLFRDLSSSRERKI